MDSLTSMISPGVDAGDIPWRATGKGKDPTTELTAEIRDRRGNPVTLTWRTQGRLGTKDVLVVALDILTWSDRATFVSSPQIGPGVNKGSELLAAYLNIRRALLRRNPKLVWRLFLTDPVFNVDWLSYLTQAGFIEWDTDQEADDHGTIRLSAMVCQEDDPPVRIAWRTIGEPEDDVGFAVALVISRSEHSLTVLTSDDRLLAGTYVGAGLRDSYDKVCQSANATGAEADVIRAITWQSAM